MEFSKRLFALVKKAGDNNKSFAQAIDISENSATNYLKKGRVPEPDILVRISSHYQKSIDWLLQDLAGANFHEECSNPTDSQAQYIDLAKILTDKPLVKELHEIIMEIENEDTEYLKEIKGLLRSELNRVKGGNLLKTAEQQFKALETRITKIEKAAHMHTNDKLRYDDPPEQKEEILNRRAIPSSFLQQN